MSYKKSNLYNNALKKINDEGLQKKWDTILDRISSIPEVRSHKTSGLDIKQIIEQEHQLSTAPDLAELSILFAFIQELMYINWSGLTDVKSVNMYEDIASKYEMCGVAIESISASEKIYRYIAGGPGFFIEYLIPTLEQSSVVPSDIVNELRDLVINAERDEERWSEVEKFVGNPVVWSYIMKVGIRMARGAGMFVTWDGKYPVDRRNPHYLHQALALPSPRDKCLLVLSFLKQDGDNFLFPTLGDAGWCRYFKSADPRKRHGWTKPYPQADSNVRPQPEAIQETPSFDRLSPPDGFRLLPY